MSKKLVFFCFLTIMTLKSYDSYSQVSSGTFGAGVSIGFVNKAQLHYNFSPQTQIALNVGGFFIGDNIVFDNMGLTFKYFFSDSDLSSYTGVSGSLIFTGDIIFYGYIPLGIQKFTSKNFAVYGGFNPGFLYSGSVAFVLGVELGASFYF